MGLSCKFPLIQSIEGNVFFPNFLLFWQQTLPDRLRPWPKSDQDLANKDREKPMKNHWDAIGIEWDVWYKAIISG